MKTADVNTALIDGYIKMLSNLSIGSKLDLISKLSMSAKSDGNKRKKLFEKSFGAFESSKTADEIIKDIRDSRTFTRQTESF